MPHPHSHPHQLNALPAGYPAVFFLRNRTTGLVLLAVTLLRPNIGLLGLLSVAAAYLFSRLVDPGKAFFHYPVNVFNPLLAGFAVGYLYRPQVPVLLLTLLIGVLTYVVTAGAGHLLWTYFRLPCLSLPFVIAGGLFHMAAFKYSQLPAAAASFPVTLLDGVLPLWIGGYFQSLGAVFFMPHLLPGLVIALCLLAGSRILFLLTLLGYYSGVLFSGLMLGSMSAAFLDFNHFNSILAAAAVGGIFLIPSRRSYLLAVAAACVSSLMLHAVFSIWWFTKIPGFVLPFNLTTLGFVYALGVIGYPGLARIPRETPEESIDFYLLNRANPAVPSGGGACGKSGAPLETFRTLALPFAGTWTVWQAFDGQWTHQGNWRYAYDFIITDEEDRSHRGAGGLPTDFYAFGKPVLSPVGGWVTSVVAHLPDSPVDEPDTVNNWGNYVIIEDDRGFFVEISHFSTNSIRIKEGQRVEVGSVLGLCGNSGYSRQPHIHVQVQLTAAVGAYTVPFSFSGYCRHNRYHAVGLPGEGCVVEPLLRDPAAEGRLIPALDEVFSYDVLENGALVDRLDLRCGIAADGTRYLTSGGGKLYFGLSDGTFRFYGLEGSEPYLKAMLPAFPCFPSAFRPGLEWQVDLPPGVVYSGWRKMFYTLAATFSHSFARVRGTFTRGQSNQITGTLTSTFPFYKMETSVQWNGSIARSTFRNGSIQLVPRVNAVG